MESSLAYYCLHKLHLLPSQVVKLPVREKAFLIAAIQLYVEEQKRQEAELKRKKRR